MKDSFKNYSTNPNNPIWSNAIKREKNLYKRNNDIRNEFERDYTRIIHCDAYKRLKHKTQVFFSPENDHICTRIEHVTHVDSISYTIANYLGLNLSLTKAIATAHDIGHSPFGHQGEKILSEISKKEIGENFWHEKNGLEFVDKLELLEDNLTNVDNLNLTYAVRDGIVSHCGEINENAIKPRKEAIDLNLYKNPNEYSPFTWEACVVKVSDKIAYLGRDIQDAITLGILDENLNNLYKLLDYNSNEKINNTVIVNNLVFDLCNNSSPDKGLCFSDKSFELINKLKKFNYKYIYYSDRVLLPNKYFEIVLNEIFNILKQTFDKSSKARLLKFYPEIISSFDSWLSQYWNKERNEKFKNDVIFNIENEKDYLKAIIYYISGMTDNFAIDTYNKIISF